MKRIVFPEINHPYVQEAIKLAKQKFPDFEAIGADNLEHACAAVKAGVADSMIAGIDYTSRDVILATRDIIGVKNPRQLEKPTFSASFIFTKENKATPLGQSVFILGDAAACKHPSFDQLYDITLETHETATKYFKYLNHDSTDSALNSFLTPRIAILSFSTLGSGGRDETISLSQSVVEKVRETHPEILIDGEMQLDAAINPRVGEKKAPNSPVAGYANILIVPDLNSGNILYKAMEQFGNFTAAGPILQGFNAPVSDLSRGSTVEDILAVIEAELALCNS
jgi:phosphate acetyltransferase pta